MPLATMDAFRDHGKARPSLEENVGEAQQRMAALERAGISIGAVTDQLVEEGVRLFANAFDDSTQSIPPRSERLKAKSTPSARFTSYRASPAARSSQIF